MNKQGVDGQGKNARHSLTFGRWKGDGQVETELAVS